MRIYYANASGQLLVSHSALVGLLASRLIETLYPYQPIWQKAAFYAGALHDVPGKMEPRFRRHLLARAVSDAHEDNGVHIKDGHLFSFKNHPRHNEVGWALLTAMADHSAMAKVLCNPEAWPCVLYTVYWHHARPLRSQKAQDDFSRLPGVLARLRRWSRAAVDEIRLMAQAIGEAAGRPLELRLNEPAMQDVLIPEFKGGYAAGRITADRSRRAVVRVEAMRSAVRSAVVTADRMVSRLTVEELADALARARTGDFNRFLAFLGESRMASTHERIDAMVERFDTAACGTPADEDRNVRQAVAAAGIARLPIAVLHGPAGCGKTKVMLQYLRLAGARRTFVIVPRTAIGEGLFKELTNEYGIVDGVELVTGASRWISRPDGTVDETPEGQQFRGSIVITTIDQVCSIVLSHDRIDMLVEMAAGTLVFDEFHELFELPAIVLLMMEVMQLRECLDSARTTHTLLISATPNPAFLKELNLGPSSVIPMDSFNRRPVELALETMSKETHPFDHVGDTGDILISNTASRACLSALKRLQANGDVICYHGRFNTADKQAVLSQVLETFGARAPAPSRILCSGPIVQASLNVAARTLHTEVCTAEDWFQRLGRANRFARHERTAMRTYAHADQNGESTVSCPALKRRMQSVRARAWLSFLIDRKVFSRDWTLAELYELYRQFHESDSARRAYDEEFLQILEKSVQTFKTTAFDPIQYPKSPTPRPKKLSARSLRGGSVHVLPMRVDLDAHGLPTGWRWLFSDDSPDSATLTLETLEFTTTDDGAGLLDASKKAIKEKSNLQAVHYFETLPSALRTLLGKGRGNSKSKLRFSTWLDKARSRETPLLLTLPWKTQSTYAFERIYVYYDGTPIGAMRRKQLENMTGSIDFSRFPRQP